MLVVIGGETLFFSISVGKLKEIVMLNVAKRKYFFH